MSDYFCNMVSVYLLAQGGLPAQPSLIILLLIVLAGPENHLHH